MYVNVEAGKIRIYPSDQIRLLHRDLRQVHQDMGQELQLFVQMGFEGEHAPDGTPWQPLAKSTVRKRGSANPILRVSGRMARTHLRANSQEAVIGSNLASAAIHQHGGEIKRQGGTLKLHFKSFKRGPRRGKTLFSRAGQATYGMRATVKAYSLRIPARPWLFNADGSIPATWAVRLQAILLGYLRGKNA